MGNKCCCFRVHKPLRRNCWHKYFSEGSGSTVNIEDYNSHNTRRLNEAELTALLNKIGYTQ